RGRGRRGREGGRGGGQERRETHVGRGGGQERREACVGGGGVPGGAGGGSGGGGERGGGSHCAGRGAAAVGGRAWGQAGGAGGGGGARPAPPEGTAAYDVAFLDLLGDPGQLGWLRARGLIRAGTDTRVAFADHRVASEAELARRCGFWRVGLAGEGDAVSQSR